MTNSWPFVMGLCTQLEVAGVRVWVAGGWAEERHGLYPLRSHGDIDLLYPTTDFAALDALLATDPVFTEILAKRFSHKRAAILHGVMVEWLRCETHDSALFTDCFDGRVRLVWPLDTLTDSQTPPRLVSMAALKFYRAHHSRVAQAYDHYNTIVSLVQRP